MLFNALLEGEDRKLMLTNFVSCHADNKLKLQEC